jgi:hypothetical protein
MVSVAQVWWESRLDDSITSWGNGGGKRANRRTESSRNRRRDILANASAKAHDSKRTDGNTTKTANTDNIGSIIQD